MPEPTPPDALLYIATGCAHCPAVLDGLTRLVKEGRLARLEVVNLSADPRVERPAGVRSVPWTRIGPFELEGALTPGELADWADAAAFGEGWAAYYTHLLENRRLQEVIRRARELPATLADLLNLLSGEETPLSTRIGISAVMEELQDTKALGSILPQLEQLTLSGLAQTRADACHFLGLTGDRRVVPTVRRLLDDEDPEVREIAVETLALLGERDGDEDESGASE
jgi:hypothetical protein